ncbi:MAG: M23 family metallopeptidase [Bacteroidales bacterium]|nr:M23 family metallopeptidase [Bacteroidales bacterium]
MKPGDKVSVKQIIGKVYANPGENSGVLHFEIWEEYKKHNPEVWLSKKA